VADNVIADGALVECWLLGDEGEGGAVLMYVQGGKWGAIDEDLAGGDVIEAFQERDNCSFSAT